MKTETNLTPFPWHLVQDEVEGRWWIEYREDGKKQAVCKMGPTFQSGREEANGRFILSAIQQRDDLLAACEVALSIWDGNPQASRQDTIATLRAAIERARGEA